MDVFICWSGDTSKSVAKALRDWLPQVIQKVKPWMSEEDIDKGARWTKELEENLKKANFGIVCLTLDNLEAPWILFESGALSNSINNRDRVSPYLLELKSTDIKGPHTLFQMTEAKKEDTLKLIKSINKALGEEALDNEILQKAFKRCWPELEEELRKIRDLAEKAPKDKKQERSSGDKLNEILQIVRHLSKEQESELSSSRLGRLAELRHGAQPSALGLLRMMQDAGYKKDEVEDASDHFNGFLDELLEVRKEDKRKKKDKSFVKKL
ncbi:MAG: toll/interleukin-1 receptor domain-containing protein [Deltaproteobacteria bacterium]|nr:toll/interleukin-1 receptor domain-containing protein [Deltaproteobacteria bacterium]